MLSKHELVLTGSQDTEFSDRYKSCCPHDPDVGRQLKTEAKLVVKLLNRQEV